MSFGQICQGNLGENIFISGDFSSGTANIPPVNPGLAPGYIYTTNPPPNDGYYCLTNDISVWASNFGWMTIQDNSPDPNGYMMVVNASYDPGLFYEEEVTGLCENTLYEFSADVYNLIGSGNLIKPNISFLIDGVIQYNTGDVPENRQWNTYGFTFTTQPNQTSVTLSLANNAPGGIGNDIALDNISFRPCGPTALILPEQIENICQNGNPLDLQATIMGSQYPTPVIQWQESFDQGITWADIPGANNLIYTHTTLVTGTYYYRYILANDPANLANSKCHVLSNVKVVQVAPQLFSIRDTLCDGLTYSFGNQSITTSGQYQDSLTSSSGCDSIVMLDLEFVPDDLDIEVNATPPTCSYTLDGSVELSSLSGGNGPYNYTIDGEPLPSGSPATDLGAGLHTFTVTDRFGCSDEITVNLALPDPFSIDLEPNLVVEMGDTGQVFTTSNFPIASYSWSPDWVACTVDCNPIDVLPTTTGYLTLTATSEEGCIAEDSVFIEVKEVRRVFIPSAFTPNGDGLNDVFTIMGDIPAAFQVDQLLIFNRWGGIAFSNSNFPLNDPSQGWDGNIKGNPAPEGVYPYRAMVRFLDDVVYEYSGTITVYR